MPTEDEIKGLPDADLTPILGELQKTATETKGEGQEQPPKKEEGLGQFKTPDDLLKGYKEVQGFATRLSQDNKALKEQLAQMNELKEQLELARLNQTDFQPQSQQQESPNIQDYRVLRISEVLEEEQMKNSQDFFERYNFAQQVTQQYPRLAKSAIGVKKAFELGDKLRSDTLKKQGAKYMESLFGRPLNEKEIAKLKTLVLEDQSIQNTPQTNITNAYMPETSTSTRTGFDQNQQPIFDRQIKESADKGDVEGTIKSIFQKVLAK